MSDEAAPPSLVVWALETFNYPAATLDERLRAETILRRTPRRLLRDVRAGAGTMFGPRMDGGPPRFDPHDGL